MSAFAENGREVNLERNTSGAMMNPLQVVVVVVVVVVVLTLTLLEPQSRFGDELLGI